MSRDHVFLLLHYATGNFRRYLTLSSTFDMFEKRISLIHPFSVQTDAKAALWCNWKWKMDDNLRRSRYFSTKCKIKADFVNGKVNFNEKSLYLWESSSNARIFFPCKKNIHIFDNFKGVRDEIVFAVDIQKIYYPESFRNETQINAICLKKNDENWHSLGDDVKILSLTSLMENSFWHFCMNNLSYVHIAFWQIFEKW